MGRDGKNLQKKKERTDQQINYKKSKIRKEKTVEEENS